ncbi:MAG: hypothetical protein ACLU3U_06685 [Gallintestinimicrobium sp.]
MVNTRRSVTKACVCDRCGVEVTKASVRRERMGHIELAAPVSHIWYFKGIPSRMGLMLDLSPRTLEKVLYFATYIVLDAGETRHLQYKQVLSEKEYQEADEKWGNAFPCRNGCRGHSGAAAGHRSGEGFRRAEKELEGCNRSEACENHQASGSCRSIP